ncbi:hypothetical protein MF410_25550 (plasmid) [Rhizobium sp. C104]|uniref:hypothetical protein n=1 Tax=Rhizobium sp. C104 TaxID=2917727 RepID=UPI001EF996B0|nr:hypothetical protein [Rhizobium sp. C104]ULJ81433.1 hypothetical protein MF410_25550 [Rhizobium sp. C104]
MTETISNKLHVQNQSTAGSRTSSFKAFFRSPAAGAFMGFVAVFILFRCSDTAAIFSPSLA